VPVLLAGHLTPPEHDRDLHLVPRLEELTGVVHLEPVVVTLDLGTHLDLLELRLVLLLLGLALAPVLLVLELAVVHDPADRGAGRG